MATSIPSGGILKIACIRSPQIQAVLVNFYWSYAACSCVILEACNYYELEDGVGGKKHMQMLGLSGTGTRETGSRKRGKCKTLFFPGITQGGISTNALT